MHKTLKGVFAEPKVVPRRNFLRENKVNIKRMQQSCDDIHKLSTRSPSRNGSATQRPNFITTVNPKHKDKFIAKSEVPPVGKKPQMRKPLVVPRRQNFTEMPAKHSDTRPSSSMSNLTVRDQGIQTEEDTKEESFLKDTIIRYPSSTNLSPKQRTTESAPLVGSLKKEGSTHSLGKSVSIKIPSETESRNGDVSNDIEFERKHFSDPKSDAKGRLIKSPVLDGRKCMKHDYPKRETLYIPPNYKMGVVPKYLQDRKEELASIIRQTEVIDVNCPEGHIPLPDEDRLRALDIAKKRFDTLIWELNKMPMTSETLRIKNRKIEIEKELTKLEESIRIFSRVKVYVKLTE
ncbi:uncharacterized protein LOC134838526 [Culicoides brevitarsis]|uniref:uncharacterized protein LOC134838526 n=1 Tax=Culicoides brevitarsis TaxID=469753 RepID=UPI00307B8105